MQGNTNLIVSRAVKNDEFYTQYNDVVSEVSKYAHQLIGKSVYCNCDTKDSAFVQYLTKNQYLLGIKSVTYSSCDFRSHESIKLLEKADVIITNPPFSLFREYFKQLIDYDKKFLIIGSLNNIAGKAFFEAMRTDKVRIGHKRGSMTFCLPDYGFKEFNNITWYTNMDTICMHDELRLTALYHPDTHPKYDNFNAINVNKLKNIPLDYMCAMGVPITFMQHYNKHQFHIIGSDRVVTKQTSGKSSRFYLHGKELYARILIRRSDVGDASVK